MPGWERAARFSGEKGLESLRKVPGGPDGVCWVEWSGMVGSSFCDTYGWPQ